jgi:sugar phosphate permease
MEHPLSHPARPAGLASASEESTYRKVTVRLVPFLFLCYVVAYLDRVNVGFAKLGMLTDLNFSETVYGLGAGIFFIGYFIFEIPSNLILHRVGARMWIAHIMISWGVISAAMMFVQTPTQFYIARFLLDPAGDRAADDTGDGHRRHEHRDDLAAPRRRVPVGEV